jgi:hypothetical protein
MLTETEIRDAKAAGKTSACMTTTVGTLKCRRPMASGGGSNAA